MPEDVLRVVNIHKSYEGVHALQGAEFSLQAGEVHALMGENGAGKSTLAKIIAGVTRPDRGETFVDGSPVSLTGPLDAQRLGISIIHQELDLFPNLSVAENLIVANQEFKEGACVKFGALERFAADALSQVGLRVLPSRRVSSLSLGEMQLVMIARALSMQARIIVMDEPTSSLFHDSVEQLFALIRGLKSRGVAVIYVSHKMDEIFRICDRVTVMRDGKTIGTRRTADASAGELIGMMVGRPWTAGDPKSSELRREEILLAVSGLTTQKIKDVSLELRKGEVLGIAGLVGAGRSELGAALAGLEKWQQGTMTLRGRQLSPKSAAAAPRDGLRLLAEDRKLEGLMMQMSVLENGTLADLPRFSPGGLTRPAREEQALVPLFRRLALKSSSNRIPVSSLSGGNQQKVLIARCLLGDPAVLFLDDPTRGIDVGAKEDIYMMIAELAEQGKGILFVSSELPELLRCCHRILVMREGRIAASLDAANTTQEEIMSFATNPVSSFRETAWRN